MSNPLTYNATPSYTKSTANLRCITGYVEEKSGFAVCDSDGQWIIEYPECEGIMITHSPAAVYNSCFILHNMVIP